MGLFALAVGSFGIGITEYVIMGLLPQLADSLSVSVSDVGLLITGYAMGVVIGTPLLTFFTLNLSQKTLLIGLMGIFTIGNLCCALAPSYGLLMGARVITSLAHGTYFGIASLVATQLVPPEKSSLAIALMFTGFTLANIVGVPLGTWLGQIYGWRITFWGVTGFGILAMVALKFYLPALPSSDSSVSFKDELKVIGHPTVLLSLWVTAFGEAGVFLFFSYIAPILTDISHFQSGTIALVLVVLGMGLLIGNIIGGKLADWNLHNSLFITLSGLCVVLTMTYWSMSTQIGALISVFVLGIAMFSIVAPVQSFVMECARTDAEDEEEATKGQALASSINIGAFNLGNAIGAWVGATLLTFDYGLSSLSFASAAMPVLAIGLTAWNVRKQVLLHEKEA